jgi:hypothetical protein
MKDTEGFALREVWKEKGYPQCIHPDLSLERSFSGVATGAYIYTLCGALITTVESRSCVTVKRVTVETQEDMT